MRWLLSNHLSSGISFFGCTVLAEWECLLVLIVSWWTIKLQRRASFVSFAISEHLPTFRNAVVCFGSSSEWAAAKTFRVLACSPCLDVALFALILQSFVMCVLKVVFNTQCMANNKEQAQHGSTAIVDRCVFPHLARLWDRRDLVNQKPSWLWMWETANLVCRLEVTSILFQCHWLSHYVPMVLRLPKVNDRQLWLVSQIYPNFFTSRLNWSYYTTYKYNTLYTIIRWLKNGLIAAKSTCDGLWIGQNKYQCL